MRTVQIHYAGSLENGCDFVNTWLSGVPVEVEVGDGSLLPALERELSDMACGERRIVRIPMDQAYGPYEESNVISVSLDRIPQGGRLSAGSYVNVQTAAGQARVKVVAIEGGVAVIDCNHELSGHDLTFEIEVVHDDSESLVERELRSTGCGCGCDKLKDQLMGDACGCGHVPR